MEERMAMLKQEKNALKREDKSKHVKRITLIQEYQKEKSLEALVEKTYRADEIKYYIHIYLTFRKQKMDMLIKRKQLGENVSKQKKEIMEKFDKTMKKNNEMNVYYKHYY